MNPLLPWRPLSRGSTPTLLLLASVIPCRCRALQALVTAKRLPFGGGPARPQPSTRQP